MPISEISAAADHEFSADEIANSVMAEWGRANVASEADVLASMYSEDALFFGSASELRRGQAEILDYFRAVPKGGVRGIVFSDTRTIPISSDAIIVASFVDFDLNFTGSSELRKWRIMLVLVRDRAGQWRIAAHHAGPRGAEIAIRTTDAD